MQLRLHGDAEYTPAQEHPTAAEVEERGPLHYPLRGNDAWAIARTHPPAAEAEK